MHPSAWSWSYNDGKDVIVRQRSENRVAFRIRRMTTPKEEGQPFFLPDYMVTFYVTASTGQRYTSFGRWTINWREALHALQEHAWDYHEAKRRLQEKRQVP